MIPILPVILCGGGGTRLWPASRSESPKQFLTFLGDKSRHSLFQQTIERINLLAEKKIALGQTIIVTNEEHRFLVLDQLRELGNNHATLILEPSVQNTAPALTLAALYAQESGDDPILIVTPADQAITDLDKFITVLIKGIEIAQSNLIAVFGVKPTAPKTDYGYMKVNNNVSGGKYLIESFEEKPDEKTAKKYLAAGGYFWNSGIFILKSSIWLTAIEKCRVDILEATRKVWHSKTIDGLDGSLFVRPDKNFFNAIPSESIDYAVIEMCADLKIPIQMVELDAGWNDMGVWDAVWQGRSKDANGNVTIGDTEILNAKNSLVYASSRLVSAVGIENLIIVETADAVLVAKKNCSHDIKKLVTELGAKRRIEKQIHRKVIRPWGWYDCIDEGDRFKVKRIQVKPGASLSLQMHFHRAEHWIVVKGSAEIRIGDHVSILTENQSAHIPQGVIHRLINPGKVILEMIEVQSGEYLGEDDILRFEDAYGRNTSKFELSK